MFPKHGTAAERKGTEAAVWLTHRQPGRAAGAAGGTNACVGPKACVGSGGGLFACGVVHGSAVRHGSLLFFGSFWVGGGCCLSCDFLELLNCKRTKKDEKKKK